MKAENIGLVKIHYAVSFYDFTKICKLSKLDCVDKS